MKRIISFIICTLFAAVLLFSCGQSAKNNPLGKWALNAEFDGEPTRISVEFADDGKGEYTIDGYMSDAFTYTVKEGSILISVPGKDETEVPFSISESGLTLTVDGSELIFERIADN